MFFRLPTPLAQVMAIGFLSLVASASAQLVQIDIKGKISIFHFGDSYLAGKLIGLEYSEMFLFDSTAIPSISIAGDIRTGIYFKNYSDVVVSGFTELTDTEAWLAVTSGEPYNYLDLISYGISEDPDLVLYTNMEFAGDRVLPKSFQDNFIDYLQEGQLPIIIPLFEFGHFSPDGGSFISLASVEGDVESFSVSTVPTTAAVPEASAFGYLFSAFLGFLVLWRLSTARGLNDYISAFIDYSRPQYRQE